MRNGAEPTSLNFKLPEHRGAATLGRREARQCKSATREVIKPEYNIMRRSYLLKAFRSLNKARRRIIREITSDLNSQDARFELNPLFL